MGRAGRFGARELRPTPRPGDTRQGHGEHAVSVAAAAFLEPVSPELALVDAALAAQLRAILDAPMRHVASIPPAGPDRDEPAGDPVEHPAVASIARIDENDPLADLIVQGPEPRLAGPSTVVAHEHDPSADVFMQETDQHTKTSGYPALPSPTDRGPEQMDATETVLREIRDRLTTPPTTSAKRRRRFRRRFTVASGLCAALALGAFATSVGFGVTQLHV
jgi:hypothetical protein